MARAPVNTTTASSTPVAAMIHGSWRANTPPHRVQTALMAQARITPVASGTRKTESRHGARKAMASLSSTACNNVAATAKTNGISMMTNKRLRRTRNSANATNPTLT